MLETWNTGGTQREDSVRLTEHLAVDLCAYLRTVITGRGDMDLDTCPSLAQAATITLSGARPCT
ncbi:MULTISPECIES: hypothetical protein [unclassified Streptomyces]|uniref:hypothetical protein n=1 Tax=unclassified Streptomyces TaxID=2593676 RepID=UPI0004BDE7F8|nr:MULTISPECIES: hypothetical protein [unclassified Streptomyces]MBG7704785.1 hypothetical protein [Streptomyces sp. MC1]